MRWCLEKDGDCNWFCVPVDKRWRFRELLDLQDYDTFGFEFDEYAVGGSPSDIDFENPEW
jgi:hypothetical protein